MLCVTVTQKFNGPDQKEPYNQRHRLIIKMSSEIRSGFGSSLRIEAEAVLKTATFRRSPVLSKLLRFLIEETAAGRASTLKSFTVAVDGLGKPSSFDAISDSSARVQMVRLRQALESHYSQHGPVDNLCIYLQPGSYAVRLGPLSTAYPALYRPLSPAPKTTIIPEPEKSVPVAPLLADASTYPVTAAPFRFNRYIAAAAAFIVLVAIALVSFWQADRPPDLAGFSPVLELMPIDTGAGENMNDVSREVSAGLANGLPRFKLARVRVMQTNKVDEIASDNEQIYRLNIQIEQGDEDTKTLFLRMDDANSDTMIWSREMQIPDQQNAIGNALVPLFAEINGPFGVVAMQSTAMYKNSNSGGYACLIKYFAFLRTRDRGIETQLTKCLEKPVEEMRLRATIFAARAFFAIESEKGQKNPDIAMAKGYEFARLAIAADPSDGAARYAMARLAYFNTDCVSARFYTQQAVEANPNSPIIMASLAALAQQCGYVNAGKLLDRAFLIQGTGDANSRFLLVLAALSQQRPDKVAELAAISVPRSGDNRTNYYLTETLIAASQDRNQDAARYWKLFSGTLPAQMVTTDQKLQRIILSPAMRRKLIDYLASKKVFAKA